MLILDPYLRFPKFEFEKTHIFGSIFANQANLNPFGPIRRLKFLGSKITNQKQTSQKVRPDASNRGLWAYFWSVIFDPKNLSRRMGPKGLRFA